MNTTIPEKTLERIGTEYSAICLERPGLFDVFTDWPPDQARKHVEACGRLLNEFTDSGQSTIDDLFRLELAMCYEAFANGEHESAKRHLSRVAALSLIGIRFIDMMCMDSNDSSDSNDLNYMIASMEGK